MVYDGFVKGLSEHGLSFEDIKNWEYCGGNANSPSEKYFDDFVKKFGHMAHPECEDKCICGVEISYNCYITNTQITPTKKMKKIQYQNKEIPILIVGSCCVKQFMDGTKLKCSRCTKTIQRRNKCSKALCTSCKNERQMEINELERKKKSEYKQCMDCNNTVLSKYNRCFTCNSKEKKGKECMDCKKTIGDKFERCFMCNSKTRFNKSSVSI